MNAIIARGNVEDAIKKSALSDSDKALLLGRYARAHVRLRKGIIEIGEFEQEVARILDAIN